MRLFPLSPNRFAAAPAQPARFGERKTTAELKENDVIVDRSGMPKTGPVVVKVATAGSANLGNLICVRGTVTEGERKGEEYLNFFSAGKIFDVDA